MPSRMSIITRFLSRFGVDGAPSAAPERSSLVMQFRFGEDGRFDYDAYRRAQTAKARSNVGDVWADPKTLDLIADYAAARIGASGFVLCHGVKSGVESAHLGRRLGCAALGTDIAPPPGSQGVVEWDFHERNPDWVGRASVVYTNALDHAYDPGKAMDAWVEQLAPGGLIFVEHTMLHGPDAATEADPFGAHPLIMPYLVLEWGRGRYCVRDIIRPPHKKPHWKPTENGVRADTDLDIWIFVIGRLEDAAPAGRPG